MPKATKLVSIIIPTYNRQALLERAIASCLAQTYTNHEIIVVDDGSRVPATVPTGVRLLTLLKNVGKAEAQNIGFANAKGEYIVYLDDDNEFLPGFLEDTVRALNFAGPEVGGVRTGRWILQGKGKPEYRDYAAPFTHTGFESIDWGFLMRREVLEKIQYDPETYGDDDADFGIRYAQLYESVPLDKPLQIAHAYMDEGAMTAPTPRRLRALDYFITKHLALYKQHPNELRYLYRLAGRNHYHAGNRLRGLGFFWQSFFALPNFRTFRHLFFIHFGWSAYDWYMDRQERKGARARMEDYVERRNI